MKPSCTNHARKRRQAGFSLVEATFSIGLLSFGFLSLAPLLGLGLKTARLARDDRATALIAQTLAQEAEQGTFSAGTAYFDADGAGCSAAQAAYTAQTSSLPVPGRPALAKTTLQITPVGAPDRARTYAVVFQVQQ